ncbi:MAG: hypothetical protein ABII74_00540 [Elusimicrobiota bacterium]
MKANLLLKIEHRKSRSGNGCFEILMIFPFLKRLFLFGFIFISSQLPVLAGDSFSFNGYYKNFTAAYLPACYGNLAGQPARGAVNNRLRLKLSWDPGTIVSANLAYDFSPRIQANSLFTDQPSNKKGGAYRVEDLNSPFFGPRDNFAVYQNLDRAFVKWKTNSADIYLGRQAIAWGSAKIVNPTDLLLPFPFNELDIEDRSGVDAIRFRLPAGAMSEVDAGYIFGRDFLAKQSASYLRNRFNLSGADISVVFLNFKENLLAGLDLSRSIGGAGFWVETAEVFSENNYLRVSSGFDYSFTDQAYAFIEYHYNGAGENSSKKYLNNQTKPAYTEGAVYLLGRHYLTPGLNYQFTPLINSSGQALINLQDGSVFFTPQIEYNIFPNTYLSLGAFAGSGRPLPHSEFGGYPDVYFFSFRLYF